MLTVGILVSEGYWTDSYILVLIVSTSRAQSTRSSSVALTLIYRAIIHFLALNEVTAVVHLIKDTLIHGETHIRTL